MTIFDMPSAFLGYEALYFRVYCAGAFKFFENLYGKVANGHVPNLRRPKIFHSEVISETKSKTPNSFRVNQRIWIASVPCTYDGCLS